MLRYRTLRKAGRILITGTISPGEAQYFARDAVRMVHKSRKKAKRKKRAPTTAETSKRQQQYWDRMQR